jgi:hypothetical protein
MVRAWMISLRGLPGKPAATSTRRGWRSGGHTCRPWARVPPSWSPPWTTVDRDVLVAAAWLHDVGYAPELAVTGFHPLDGAQHLEAAGFGRRIAALGGAPSRRPIRGR